MKSLSCLTLSDAILVSKAGSWDKYCTVMLCEAVIVCCIVKTALTSETFFKTKLQLYIDDIELENIITSQYVLVLKAISAVVMLAVYKLHESQKVFICQLLWYLRIN